MKIVHINNIDVPGGYFNGYELHKTMNQMGHQCSQIVLHKNIPEEHTVEILCQNMDFVHMKLQTLEQKLAMQNILFPYSLQIQKMKEFKNADIVHYHLLHNQLMSLYDLPELFAQKPSVWTIHDPWVITGHCVHPLNCQKWLDGCMECPDLERVISISRDNASKMWKLKKKIFKQINPTIIVATHWMKNLINRSPLTSHWNKIHVIPFGVQPVSPFPKKEAKKKLGISPENTVISFRCHYGGFKGVDYILQALDKLQHPNLFLLTVDGGKLPATITNKYASIELGTITSSEKMKLFYSASDIFLMPSIAESFGMMSIEAMSYGLPVICFKNTVLEEITAAPDCGIAVAYQNVEELCRAIAKLVDSYDEQKQRGLKGIERVTRCYNYEKYVQSYIDIYQKLL